MEKLLTEMDSVEDTHQNCSSGKDGQVSTQSKNSRNVEPSGIPEKEYHTILVNEEDEQAVPTVTNAPSPTNNEQAVPTATTDNEGDNQQCSTDTDIYTDTRRKYLYLVSVSV